ncbi:hypothetical protein [Streptomyces sp. NPDC041003]
MRNHWVPAGLQTFVAFAGPLLLAASTITPFILDTDVLGHWLADIVGLL